MHPLNSGQYRSPACHTVSSPQRITRHLVIHSNSAPGMRFARGHMSRLGSFVIAVKITPLEREREREKKAANCRERDSILECFDIIFKDFETRFINDGKGYSISSDFTGKCWVLNGGNGHVGESFKGQGHQVSVCVTGPVSGFYPVLKEALFQNH